MSAGAQSRPAASSCLVGFGMCLQREFHLPGSRTTCAECRYSPCLPILHKQHDAPTGERLMAKERTFPTKMPNNHSTRSTSNVSTTATCNISVWSSRLDANFAWCGNRLFSHHIAQKEVRLLRITPVEICRCYVVCSCLNCCIVLWQILKVVDYRRKTSKKFRVPMS